MTTMTMNTAEFKPSSPTTSGYNQIRRLHNSGFHSCDDAVLLRVAMLLQAQHFASTEVVFVQIKSCPIQPGPPQATKQVPKHPAT
mmetsp:Transcript_29899/g.46892  ORF Transcript_29899/g.46892 Transcript_29899/m.46892 type:complete len:85 (-) Transcript_29899:741-995(-)